MGQYQQPQAPYPAQPATVVPWGGILATTGAVVLAVALFLPWASFSFTFIGEDFSASTNGFEQWPGLFAALAAVGSVVLGILAMTIRTRPARKGMAIALLAVGGMGLASAIVALVINLDTLGYGLYVAIAGALLIVAGGVMALREAPHLPERRAPRYGQAYYQQYLQASPPPGYPPSPQPPGYPPSPQPPGQPPAG
jgi:peptidoglycan/LPS O-acetylase OafA/YrhL